MSLRARPCLAMENSDVASSARRLLCPFAKPQNQTGPYAALKHWSRNAVNNECRDGLRKFNQGEGYANDRR